MIVHLRKQIKNLPIDSRGVKRFAKSVLKGEGRDRGSVTLVFTDDNHMRDLNQRFRNRDRTTDVLAFPLDEEDETGQPYLGDVIISVPRAIEQAPRFKNDPESELARLITHGLLHLLGYDHHSPWDGRRMKAAERKALAGYEPGTLATLGGGELV